MQGLLDDIDRKLITLLMEDASRTNVAMARLLEVSDGTVRNRIQNLIESGVIQIVAIVDPRKVGQRLQIIAGVEVELAKTHDVAHALADLDETTYVSYTTGEYDLILVAAFASDEELFHFLTEKIPAIPGIRRVRTNHVLRTIKRTFRYDRFLERQEVERFEDNHPVAK